MDYKNGLQENYTLTERSRVTTPFTLSRLCEGVAYFQDSVLFFPNLYAAVQRVVATYVAVSGALQKYLIGEVCMRERERGVL